MASPYKSPSTRRGRSQGSSAREDRKVLFQDANTGSKSRKKSGASSTASEAQSIAQSLQRTQNLLKNELNRVSQVANAIDEDGKLLQDTKTDFQSLNVSGAKKALTSLQRAQQREQRVLMASVLFFFTVVAYIMWERIFIKLPFVERTLNMVLGSVRIWLGNGMVLVGEGFQLALEKWHEIMEHVQDIIDG